MHTSTNCAWVMLILCCFKFARVLSAGEVTLVNGFKVSSKTHNSLTLVWTAGETTNYDSYQINTIHKITNTLKSVEIAKTATNKTISNLNAGHYYDIGISVMYGIKEVIAAIVKNEYPTFLTNLKKTAYSNTTIDISWDLATLAQVDSYKLEYRIIRNRTLITIPNINKDAKSYQLTNLLPGYLYEIWGMVVQNSYDLGPDKTSIITEPNEVSNLTLTSRRTNSLGVSWNYHPGTNIRYYLKIKNSGGSILLNKVIPDRTTAYEFSGLDPGSQYNITILVGVWGYVSKSGEIALITYTYLNPIRDLKQTTKTSVESRFTWLIPSPSAPISGYEVTLTRVGDTQPYLNNVTSDTFKHHSSLTPGETYEIKVKAYIQSSGLYVDGAPLTKLFTMIPHIPPGLRVVGNESGITFLTLEWNTPADIFRGFFLYWKLNSANSSFSKSNLLSNDTRKLRIDNLENDKKYEIKAETLSGYNATNTLEYSPVTSGVFLVGIFCSTPNTGQNAEMLPHNHTQFKYRSQVMYRCKTGFETQSGDLTITCMSDKSWSGVPASCQEILCPAPGSSNNTVADSNNPSIFRLGSKMTYTCKPGFELMSGDLTIICMDTKLWSGMPPDCEEVKCVPPVNFTNAYTHINETKYIYRTKVNFSCYPGHIVVSGDLTLFCLENGQWSGQVPNCQVVNCSIPENVTYSTKVVTGLTHMSSVTYMCDERYKCTQGDLVRHCLGNGQWNGTVPTCKEKICHEPVNIHHGTWKRYQPTQNWDYVEYRCFHGYFHIRGSLLRNCTEDETWSDREPICFPGPELMKIFVPGDPEPVTWMEKLMFRFALYEVDLYPSHVATGMSGLLLIILFCVFMLFLDIVQFMMKWVDKYNTLQRVDNIKNLIEVN